MTTIQISPSPNTGLAIIVLSAFMLTCFAIHRRTEKTRSQLTFYEWLSRFMRIIRTTEIDEGLLTHDRLHRYWMSGVSPRDAADYLRAKIELGEKP